MAKSKIIPEKKKTPTEILEEKTALLERRVQALEQSFELERKWYAKDMRLIKKIIDIRTGR
jgi:hypothetical protein